jgi:hypothetical protein
MRIYFFGTAGLGGDFTLLDSQFYFDHISGID